MKALAARLLSARRSGWLRNRPVFEKYASVSVADIAVIEARLGRELPVDLRAWLCEVGFGDLAETLSFRAEWIQPVESGHLRRGFRFAQDELGNFDACSPRGNEIIFFSRSEPAYGILSSSFQNFLEELERRDFEVIEWASTLELSPYAWAAV